MPCNGSILLSLRDAGDAMFLTLVFNLGCGHADPRRPSNEACPYCRTKAKAMDRWDDALMEAAPALGEAISAASPGTRKGETDA